MQRNTSSRRTQKLVTFNCAELVQTLAEGTLFGHVRGAFTGAVTSAKGLFEHAQRGTLFLDEVAELPSHLQPMLLRAVEYGRIRPVGATDEIAVDVRIVSATNQPFEHLIREGRFRSELYQRLRGIEVHIPPLRERREDIRPLVDHFLSRVDSSVARRLTPSAYRVLETYSWPGNVRELKALVERIVHVSEEARITDEIVRSEIVQSRAISSLSSPSDLPSNLDAAVAEYELRILQQAFDTAGTQKGAAELLGLRSQQAFHTKLESAKKRANGVSPLRRRGRS